MKKIKGFSLIEAIISLLIIGIVLGIIGAILKDITLKKQINTVANQTQTMAKQSSIYLAQNYSTFISNTTQTEWSLPYSSLPIRRDLKITNYYKQSACLYVFKNLLNCTGDKSSDCILSAYLFFANPKGLSLDLKTASQIASAIGGNAGVVTLNNHKLIAKDKNYSLELNTTPCNFSPELMANTFFVNLTGTNSALSQIVDPRATNNGYKDIALQRNSTDISSTTMQSNLYLDNVIKESSVTSSFYCSASKMPSASAIGLCTQYGNTNGFYMYSGTASWVSSILNPDGKTCNSSAVASFYKYIYSCQNVQQVAQASCQSLNNNLLAFNYLTNYNYTLNGNHTCTITASGNFSSFNCNFDHNMQQFVDLCHQKWAGDVYVNDGTFPLYGDYNRSKNRCEHMTIYCTGKSGTYPFYADTWQDMPMPPNVVPTYRVCPNAVVNAASTAQNQGQKNCGNMNLPAIESFNYHPEEHQYRALDFGVVQTGPNVTQHLRMISAAAPGVASNINQLNIDNAGFAAGIVLPTSSTNQDKQYVIVNGTSCSAPEVGKMVRQPLYDNNGNITIIQGKLQCLYSPAYCPNQSYCYLPIQTSTQTYTFISDKSSFTCPSGTIVDSNTTQSQFLDKNVSSLCKTGSINFYITGPTTNNGLVIKNTVNATCTSTKNIIIPILAQVRCTNVQSNLIIDDYKQR